MEEIDTALGETQIEILFQPQFACESGKLIGAEALSRWNHPRLGKIGAEALFELARRAGEVNRLTRHIVGRALEMAAEWPDHLRISLNVTAMDLAGEGFVDMIIAQVAEAAFAPERVTLEITEQVLVHDVETAAARLDRLAAKGIGIALDDFGAGFCNFHYLKRFPLHSLKLDRSMIEGIAEDERDLAVLRGILAMARALGLSVTAEGVESEAQREVVSAEGCAAWQGFFGAEPMAGDSFLSFATAR